MIGRENLTACEVGGYCVPRGTTILMSQWVVQRDPRWYESPEEFRPERWLVGPEGLALVQRLPRYAYFPFSGGPRLCIGNTFAMMVTVLVLATLSQHYRFTLAPGQVIEGLPSFTLRPRNGLLAVLARREEGVGSP
jgi:cytochrome P450